MNQNSKLELANIESQAQQKFSQEMTIHERYQRSEH
jgi:hypothetical protein